MSLPKTTREYRLLEGSKLSQSQSDIPALKSHEVLLKVQAVSLQFRDTLIIKGQYPRPCVVLARKKSTRSD
jgi:NADPH:quinone reductase-like Zn-dependent oxidoreductase